jgi:hypothetical protein
MAAPNGYVGNMWSRMLYNMSKFEVRADIGVNVPDISFFESWSVDQALIHTFFLLLLFSIVIAMIMLVGNLAWHWMIGSAMAVAIYFIGYMLIRDSMWGLVKYSLMAHGILAYHNISGANYIDTGSSYLLFAFLIIILSGIGHRVILHCDFKHSISEING